MRKLLLIILGALLGITAMARDFQYEYKGQTLTYTVLSEEDKTVQTKEGDWDNSENNVSDNLEIPSEAFDGQTSYNVVALAAFSFVGCHDLKSVTIPTSVTSIGNLAFAYCNQRVGKDRE